MGTYVKVATVDKFPKDQGLRVEAGGQKIALFRVGSDYFAIGDECSHVGGPLCEGMIHEKTVLCPWHGAQFDLMTGAGLAGPARGPVESYPVRVNGSDIEVEIKTLDI
jgi:nitrite reductase/ring-hydroxylating ferredoxin subunit